MRQKRKSRSPGTAAALEQEYRSQFPLASRMANCVKTELLSLVEHNKIPLAVPMEHRVKEWQSITDKLDRINTQVDSISDLNDLIGFRLIVLFRSDIEKLDQFIQNTFSVISVENAFNRLNENQFGYQSVHYVVKLPDSWLTAPSNAGLGHLKAEIQVRTISQHTWAAASHKLQYKQENAVPPDLRRSINRLSALLETVDLELERIVEQKQQYNATHSANPSISGQLNSDIVQLILDQNFPESHLDFDENYADLIYDILALGIKNTETFERIIKKHKAAALIADRRRVKDIKSGIEEGFDSDRIDRGVFYTHVGLARVCLSKEYGDERLMEIHYSKRENRDEDSS